MRDQKPLFFFLLLCLTVLAGVIINAPYHNFQDYISQGDHGRDLYAAQAVLRGDLPYKDFWWVYGPLMPYYYALCFKLLGVHIPSVLIGKALANALAGVFFFLGFSRLFSPMAACIAAIWFMAFHSDFFFTYNHAGGIAVLLGVLWMNCGYLKTSRLSYGWGALIAVFILGLIKINFAVTALAMTFGLVAVVDLVYKNTFSTAKKLFAVAALGLIPLLWFAIYAHLLSGLSIAEIRQCLPYLGGDEPYNNYSPLQTLPILFDAIKNNIMNGWRNSTFCVVIILSLIRMAYLLIRKDIPKDTQKAWFLILGFISLFYVVNLHEFLKSGVFYRTYWSQPFSVFASFAIIAIALGSLKLLYRGLTWALIAVMIVVGAWGNIQKVNTYKNGAHFLGSELGGVYIGNDRVWIQTVVLTTRQLNKILKDEDTFFALPYDCLYYYLTGKKSPTRQLIFFDHINIPTEQEAKILADLERNKVTTILVSSRQSAREHGLGSLGVTYCPMIAQYINTNFTATAKIGDWTNEPGWAWGHGTLILNRNPRVDTKTP